MTRIDLLRPHGIDTALVEVPKKEQDKSQVMKTHSSSPGLTLKTADPSHHTSAAISEAHLSYSTTKKELLADYGGAEKGVQNLEDKSTGVPEY